MAQAMRRIVGLGLGVLCATVGCGDDAGSSSDGSSGMSTASADETRGESSGSGTSASDDASTSGTSEDASDDATTEASTESTSSTSTSADSSTTRGDSVSTTVSTTGDDGDDTTTTTTFGDDATTTTGFDVTTGPTAESTTDGEGDTGSTGDPTSTSTTEEGGASEGAESGSSDSGIGEEIEFPAIQPFGDNVQELDLVGTWGLNWNADGWNSVLTIAGDGAFTWVETESDCSSTDVASGRLWVDGVQIVMHVDRWDGALPWETSDALGRTFAAPFQMRLSFSLQGGIEDAYLALSGPPGLTRRAAYTGQSYVQLTTEGEHLGGEWRGESELWAGYDDIQAEVIVRDVSTALTEAESTPDDPQGTGTRSIIRTFFPEPSSTSTFENFNWTCLDGCPDPAGTTYVAGTNLFTYGPYAGYRHLMTFASGRTFRSGVESGCEGS